jgi:hypothetical protein
MRKGFFILILLALAILLVTLLGRDASPPDVADLTLPPLTPGEEANAAVFFREAADNLYCPVDQSVLKEMLGGVTNAPQLVTALMASNQHVFAQLDRGLNCRVCILPEPETDSDMPAEQCRDWTKMGCILALQAQRELEGGQLDAAAATCERLIRFGSLVQQHSQTLLQFLIGQTILEQGLWHTRLLTQHPEVASSPVQELARQLDLLIPPGELLARPVLAMFHDSASLLDQMKTHPEALMGERADARKTLFASKLFASAYFFRPNETLARFAEQHRELLANLSLPLSSYKKHPAPGLPQTRVGWLLWWIRPNALGRLMLSFSFFDPVSLGEIQCSAACSWYGTRLMLACRLHHLKHGAWPSSFVVLVPEYLGGIPTDPYGGTPFRYSREKAMIYAVGTDLIDDGGKGDDIVYSLVEQ